MTEEEKETIEWLERLVKINKRDNSFNTFAEILLNMIQKQSKIIDVMIEEYEYNARINLKNFCEDEMRKDKCIQDCRICVRKYFEEGCK